MAITTVESIIADLISACETALQVGENCVSTCDLEANKKLTLAVEAAREFISHPPYVVSARELTPEDIAKMDFSRPGARLQFQPEMGANLEIVCKYTCSECGINRVEVRVPARPVEMDVVHWVQEVAARIIGADHAFRSPKCASRVMSEMLIPISGAPHIGFPSVS